MSKADKHEEAAYSAFGIQKNIVIENKECEACYDWEVGISVVGIHKSNPLAPLRKSTLLVSFSSY